MGAQDHVEKALRELHIILSQSEVYDKDKNLVIVDKKRIVDALNDLNLGVYEVMDEHEFTKRGREQAEREVKRRGEEIIRDATGQAEDVYAASVLYTDEALKRVQYIMQEAMESVKTVYDTMQEAFESEKRKVSENQLELSGSLQDLRDTNKYLQIIEERNMQLRKAIAEEKEELPPPAYAGIKPDIKINETYFIEHGFSLETEEEQPEEKEEKITAEISVNLDSEYFKWKEREANGEKDDEIADIKRNGKKSIFGKLKK